VEPTPPPPEQPAPPAPPKRGRMFRRDFLTGAVAGVAGAKAWEWAAPPGWSPWLGMPRGAKLTYAQNGEDLVAGGALASVGVITTAIRYLDIGAWEPIESNNTYYFYRDGGRGVLVEPNIEMTPKLKRKRPRDTVITAGIGITAAKEADFYIMSGSQLHTFDKEQAERLDKTGLSKIKYVMKMPLLDINAVMAEHFDGGAPDYLSVDVEGLELPIVKTIDFDKHRPKVITIDTLVTGTFDHRPEALEFMASKDYDRRGLTFANSIFVDKRLKRG
jgi:FkbM family methyltransferase